MAFDSDANLIINTGTGDNIGATIGTDFVNDQHHQLFKLGFGASAEFQRVGDGSNVNTAPFPTRLYQSGTGTAITSTPFSGNHALDVNIRGVSGAGNLRVTLQDGVSGANSLQIQGASSGYPVSITTDAPLPISGSLTATLSGSTVGVTNTNEAALYVQQKAGTTFSVSGNLSATVDQIGGGTLSVQGFTGMTPLVVTGGVIATLSGGSTFNIGGIVNGITIGVTAANLDIRGLTTNKDSVKVQGYGAGDSVKTVLGWDNGGLFTALGVCSDNNSLNVNIAGLSSLSVTADISSLSDLSINNPATNAVPIQGATVDAIPVFVSGTAGSAYPIGVTTETPLMVDIVTMPSVSGSVSISNTGLTLFGGTIDTVLSAGVTNTNATALFIQPKVGITFGVTGDVGVHVGGIVSGVTIGIGGNGMGSGITVGVTASGLDIRGLTANGSKDSVKVFGSGSTSAAFGQATFLMGLSAGGNTEIFDSDGEFQHIGSSGGHLLTHVVNPLQLSGDLTISNTSLGISTIAAGSVVGVTNTDEQALYIQLKKGATLASSVTGDVGIGVGGITFASHSIAVVGDANTIKQNGHPIGTVLMGFTAGVTADLGEGVYQGMVDAVGSTLESIRSNTAALSNLTSINQNVLDIEAALVQAGNPFLSLIRNMMLQVVASGTDTNTTASQVNTNVESITLPTVGFVKTWALTSGDAAPTMPSFTCKRGVRIKCESNSSAGGMRVGFVSPATNSNADTTSALGFNLLEGEEIYIEIDNLNEIEVAKCGDLLNFTVIAT